MSRTKFLFLGVPLVPPFLEVLSSAKESHSNRAVWASEAYLFFSVSSAQYTATPKHAAADHWALSKQAATPKTVNAVASSCGIVFILSLKKLCQLGTEKFTCRCRGRIFVTSILAEHAVLVWHCNRLTAFTQNVEILCVLVVYLFDHLL